MISLASKSNKKQPTISSKLQTLADANTAKTLAWFFKTGPGEYGEGDKFLGIRVPDLRTVAKEFYQNLLLPDLKPLLKSAWHEERLAALLILVLQYQKTADNKNKKNIYNFYLAHRAHINNWDLVDLTAPNIVGRHLLLASKKEQKILFTLAQDANLWSRRIAMVATHAFIRENIFTPTLQLVELLLSDKEDLMHKACGWMLREAAKRNQPLIEDFLRKHYEKLPRTTLRYAIERFSPELRKKFLLGKM